MPRYERRAARGRQRGRRDRTDIGQAVLHARRAAGVTQATVAAAAGISQTQYGRIERGEADVGLEILYAIGEIVGMTVRVSVFPGGSPIRDAGHVRALARLQALLPPHYRWRTEVPLPISGDQRAIDAMISEPRIAAAFELETRLLDAQDTTRRILLKARDAGIAVVVLVLPDTAFNRMAVAAADVTLRAAFPLRSREVLVALRNGECPRDNGIIFV
jgi:transcriptional regulator with XRE-family HTH domain